MAIGWKFRGRVLGGLSIGHLRTNKPQANCLKPIKYCPVSTFPVVTPVIAVAVKNVPVARDNYSVTFLSVNQSREIRDNSVG